MRINEIAGCGDGPEEESRDSRSESGYDYGQGRPLQPQPVFVELRRCTQTVLSKRDLNEHAFQARYISRPYTLVRLLHQA